MKIHQHRSDCIGVHCVTLKGAWGRDVGKAGA